MEIIIHRATHKDKGEWFRMRKCIWPDAPDEYLDFDLDDILASDNDAVFFAFIEDQLAGMIEARIREYGEGCETSPVGYIEAWFVQEEYRGKNVAGVLTQAAENWAREKGCTEMASDTWLDNECQHPRTHKIGI